MRSYADTSDIFGVSGRAMMATLADGERDPKALAELARTRMRTKIGRRSHAQLAATAIGPDEAAALHL
jgi:hypothetical protein